MNHKKVKFAIGSVLVVFAIGYLISAGISSTSQYFFTVDELLAQKVAYTGAGLKVKGRVVNGSIARDPADQLLTRFSIQEKTGKLLVVYKGITPDMFQDGGEVVVEGTLSRDGTFHANVLMTSCPSKYEAEKEEGKTHPGSVPVPGTEPETPDFNKVGSGSKTRV
ncbi:MAG: cytochrome c biogenesis protein CcmE [Nitrospinae bacterium CG11_big_fil_rev_8_21_14_0_20_56_8]|nr:MAG: cytochrome c biogenesis protein CcmE [Nitrospinae bacterium CG11_big_fil_rev_8_21_14_0_20_56_8]